MTIKELKYTLKGIHWAKRFFENHRADVDQLLDSLPGESLHHYLWCAVATHAEKLDAMPLQKAWRWIRRTAESLSAQLVEHAARTARAARAA